MYSQQQQQQASPQLVPQQPIQPQPIQTQQQQAQQSTSSELPYGWVKAIDAEGRTYYVDHINKKTSWLPPTTQTPQLQKTQTQQSTIAPSIAQSPYLAYHQSSTSSLNVPMAQSIQIPQPIQPQAQQPGTVVRSQFDNTPSQNISTNPPNNIANNGMPNTASSSFQQYPGQMQQPQQPQYNIGQMQTPQQYMPNSIYGSQPQPQQQIPQTYVPQQVFSRAGNIPTNVSLSLTKPQWDPAIEHPKCASCGVEFSFFTWRHTCRCCFKQFCDACSSKRQPVFAFGHTIPQRVCNSCSSHLLLNDENCLSRLTPYFEMISKDKKLAEQAIDEYLNILLRRNPSSYDMEITNSFTTDLREITDALSHWRDLTPDTRVKLVRIASFVRTSPQILSLQKAIFIICADVVENSKNFRFGFGVVHAGRL